MITNVESGHKFTDDHKHVHQVFLKEFTIRIKLLPYTPQCLYIHRLLEVILRDFDVYKERL